MFDRAREASLFLMVWSDWAEKSLTHVEVGAVPARTADFAEWMSEAHCCDGVYRSSSVSYVDDVWACVAFPDVTESESDVSRSK